MRTLWLMLAAAGVLLSAPPARADDKVKAAEHFQRARALEKREDWQSAIEQYQRAYELAPHPSVLYNIAVNYEHLGEHREAARHFLRYLDESESAEDEDEVLARVAELRERPCPVDAAVKPEEATLYVDGEERGRGPQRLRLDPGSHRLYVAHRGRRSPTRQILCEYGEPLELPLDLDAAPGTLRVDADVSGAEVRIDGEVKGRTPWVGHVAAGDHVVEVRRDGYQPHQQEVSVPAHGGEQVLARLVRLDGGDGGGEGEDEASSTRGFLMGLGYGFDGSTSGRYAVSVGYRPLERLDASLLLGRFGAGIGNGAGGEGRFFLTTSALRPYLRAGVLFGDGGSSDTGGGTGVETGIGLLWVGSADGRSRRSFSLEYYLEASAQIAFGDGGGDDGITGPDEDEGPVSFPILLGLVLRFG